MLDRYGHLLDGTEDAVDDNLEAMARAGQAATEQYGQVIALR